MIPNTERLSIKEKIGYGLGDTAANFIFQTMVVFQLSFYTDTYGITAAAAGTLFMVVRVWDAVFDPLMGVIADRTRTRWGKFRPWILWTAAPFGLMGVLTFLTPDFGPSGKLAYTYATYILLMMVYSANNLPYSALTGVITGDIGERTSLSSYRFVCAMLGAFVVQCLALPMVKYFGHGDNARGYRMTMGLLSLVAVGLFVVTFLAVRERIQPDPRQKSSVLSDFASLAQNGPWIALFALTVLIFVGYTMRAGAMVYYFKYFVGREDLFSIFNLCGLAAVVIGILFSTPLALRFGKRDVYIAALFLSAALMSVFLVLPAYAVGLMFAVEILRQLSYGLTTPLLWAMMADVADYGEWTTGRRATGIVYSALVFGLKVGLGLGGGIAAWVLSRYGYVPNAVQSVHALLGIRMAASVLAATPYFLGVVCLLFYKIGKQLNIKITEELAERRSKYASLPH
ncbi:MAG: MFS transporter [Bryobacteraceae bacterium]|jgi:sugar (glycoside-pentoside-hexuronide) transporter